jgi:preprotein translocase SecE subunit
VSYKSDQGRYARMVAFWGLTLIVGYGCFHGGGLVMQLDGWLGAGNNPTFIDPFPLVGTLKLSTLLATAALAIAAFVFHRILNRPHVADVLIETEAEMHRVTWPTWPETWHGTVAVTAMVVVLFLFLTAVDLLLAEVMTRFMGSAS